MKLSRALVLAFAFTLVRSALLAAQYKIDPAHSEITFKVRHMMISKVQGRFDKFSGSFSFDEKDAAQARAEATLEAGSINTGNEKRDEHLKSADFFDAAQHPDITFKSTKFSGLEGGKGKLDGLLKIHGVEKPVTLNVEFGGAVKDPWGSMRAGFELTGNINRKDFGINWSKLMDNGGAVVGDDVEILARIEGVQDAESEKKQIKMEQKPEKKK